MNLITLLFGRKTTCPRCLGKGQVDNTDIKRLKKQHYWVPGQCAYCKGRGKVPEKQVAIVPVDTTYLTTDLPAKERRQLLQGNPAALQRAKDQEAWMNQTVRHIEHWHYVQELSVPEIVEQLVIRMNYQELTQPERDELTSYVEAVLRIKPDDTTG